MVSARQAEPERAVDMPLWGHAPATSGAGAPGILGGDQIPDVVISPGTGGLATRVLDGVSLTELGNGFPFGPSLGAGVRTALGDVSGDGVDDIVTAMGPGGSLVRLFNGLNIAEIASGHPFGPGFSGGVSVAVGDVNGDGREDIIVGQASGGGTVRAFSGADISLILSQAPFGAGYSGGVNVAAGDVDGDNRADIIIGQASGGTVSIISGASHAVTVSGAPYGPLHGGVSVAAGDVNGDGRADVIAAPGSGPGPVLVYDVGSVSLLGSFVPYSGFGGGVRVAAADLTSDGRVEILTVPGPGTAPDLRVFDGATFALLNSLLVYPSSYTSGVFVASRASTPPRFTSAVATTFTAGVSGTFAVTAVGSPGVTSITQSGSLPTGVTFTHDGAGSGTLAGTPEPGTGGTYALTLSATNGVGAPVIQDFTLTVNEAPAITSASTTTFSAGAAGSFTITTTGFPGPSLSSSGALPAGVTFTSHADGTATLAGTTVAGGTYPLTITADNGIGPAAAQAFVLTVDASLVFTSASATSFVVGTAGSFTVTTAGSPVATTISATGALPSGVTFTNNADGTATLAGTPASGSAGVYPLVLNASNGVGTPAMQNFTLTVNQPAAITSPASTAFTVGSAGGFTLTSTGFPVPALSASGALPGGVTFTDNGDGTATLGGTPAPGTAAVYPLTMTATNGVGTPATQNFTLTVQPCTGVTLSPPGGALTAGTFEVVYGLTFTAAGGTGHTFAVTGGALPTGLTLASGGALSGTPTNTGTFVFTVTATNSIGCTGSNAYSISVAPDAQDETFSNGVGNTQYSVGAGTPTTPAVVVSGTVLSNDVGPGTLTAGPASIATAQGGQVAMSTTGTFLYTPPTGFAGPSDTFTYTLTDGNGLTDTAVVTINSSGVIWYVDASASAGDGRSHNPFNAMPAASAAALEGHVIYVHQGSPSGTTNLKDGQTLWGAGATFTLNGLVIAATMPPTLQGTIALADNVLVNSLSVDGGSEPAIHASGLTGTEVVNAVSVVGATKGLDLSDLGGTLTVTSGSISGTSDAGAMISGGTGTVTIGASIVNTVGRSVEVQNRTAGSLTFSGPISDTGAGILLDSNGGSTIAFTGGLALLTGSHDAFTATGGGTLTVTQDNITIVNTIATTTGTALNVTDTEISSAGMTFRSISAGTAAFSPGAGIILDNTGTAAQNGGLTVTGNGVAQSGGLIRRKSGADGIVTEGVGIYLNNTKDASFNWVELNNFDNSAIVGRNVVGFLLSDSVINIAGTTAGILEGPLIFGLPNPGGVNGLLGTGVIRNTSITAGFEDNVVFFNQSGSMTLVVERTNATPGSCQIGSNSATTGGRGLTLQVEGTAVATATIDRCRFRNNRAIGLLATASDDASLTLLVTGSATDSLAKSEFVRSPTGQGEQGIVVSNAGNADVTATIENAIISNFGGAGIWVGQAPGNASALSTLRATITGNAIDSPANATDGSVVARLSSTVGEVSEARLLIADNTGAGGIHQYGLPPGILITTPDAGTTPRVDLTIANNHVDMTESAPGSGIRGPVGVAVEATHGSVCGNITANTSHWYPLVEPQGGGIRVEQADSGTLVLERGTALGTADAATVLAANNPAPVFTTMVTEVFGTVAVVENNTCQLPSAP
ncbi:MAG: VCBS repeat-containing protein [Acidobacteria bacterium]|nr:VCBS repeat-containing protein [Acidobacteriota bacterium]